MNLAELRKKAQRERREEIIPPVVCPEEFDSAEDAPAQAAAEPPSHADAVCSAVHVALPADPEPVSLFPRQEPETGPVRAAAPSVDREAQGAFDPLAILLAGREAVLDDEAAPAEWEAASGAMGDDFREFLCFRVSSETYAINIMQIKEIIKPREVTEVPRAPAFVSGVLSLRGIIIPVFNMRLRLGLPGGERSARDRIVVLKKGEELYGVQVDEVIQVVRIAATTIEKPPAVLDGIDRDFVSGIGRFDGQMLILLNQEKILDISLA